MKTITLEMAKNLMNMSILTQIDMLQNAFGYSKEEIRALKEEIQDKAALLLMEFCHNENIKEIVEE